MDGVLIARKICGEFADTPNYTPFAAALHVSAKQPRSGSKDRHKDEPFVCFARQGVTGPRNPRRWFPIAEINLSQHIAVFFAQAEAKTPELVANGTRLPARNAGGRIIAPYAMTQEALLGLQRLHRLLSTG